MPALSLRQEGSTLAVGGLAVLCAALPPAGVLAHSSALGTLGEGRRERPYRTSHSVAYVLYMEKLQVVLQVVEVGGLPRSPVPV